MRSFVCSHSALAQDLHSPHLGPCLRNDGGMLCSDMYLADFDMALLRSWLDLEPVLLHCRFAWTSPGCQLTRFTVIVLFCSPCLRAVRWDLSELIPYPASVTVLPDSWCFCSCREAPAYSSWTILSSGLKIIFILLCLENRVIVQE